MRKLLMTCFVALGMCINVNAQDYYTPNSIFPILNTITTEPEYTGAIVSQSYNYMGKTICLSDYIDLWMGETRYARATSGDLGSFISFRYVTKQTTYETGRWYGGAEAMQFAFHPAGVPKWDYNDNNKPSIPLYAFTYSDSLGLNLINVQNRDIIAHLGRSSVSDYAYLTVFAGSNRSDKDIIVIAGKNNFEVYGTFIDNESIGVRQIYSSDEEPAYFDMNGIRHDTPQKGVNIVVDGETAKKVVVK